MKRLASIILSFVVALSLPLAPPVAGVARASEPLFGPSPFLETAPLLVEIHLLLDEKSTKKKRQAALKSLRDWLRRAPKDPIAIGTARWLEARLVEKNDGWKAAAPFWEKIALSPAPFSDEARLHLAKRASSAEAAHWRLSRHPSSPDFLKEATRGVRDLQRLHQPERALGLVELALKAGMSPRTRHLLTHLYAELYRDLGQKDRASQLLLETYWATDAKTNAQHAKALASLGVRPTKTQQRFHEALWASRSDARKLLKGVKRPRNLDERIRQAMLKRWERKELAETLASLPTLDDPKIKNTDTWVHLALTRGMLCRRLDDDKQAISAFQAISERHPEHPLAPEADDQAAYLHRLHGEHDAADRIDLRILERALPGPRHQRALWRLGFWSTERKKYAAAEKHLRELEWRHGGEPDRHTISWYERARYWRGRASQLAKKNKDAIAHYEQLKERSPAGWYARLAQARLDTLGKKQRRGRTRSRYAEAADVRGWRFGPEEPISTAIALYRLGDEAASRRHFQALLNAQQLPGNGRRLLSDLWEIAGDSAKARAALRYAAIPPTMPGEDSIDTYYTWYPINFEDALLNAARQNQISHALLAGIVSVETRFDARLVSSAGATGPAQLLRSTGTAIGRKVYGADFDPKTISDPDVNLALAARYLSDLIAQFNGQTALAVTAYNAGPYNVQRWIKSHGHLDLDAFVETIPFEEARRYVMRVISDAEIYRRLYELDDAPMHLQLSLGKVRK